MKQNISAPLHPLWKRGFRLLFVVDAVALYGLMILITTVRFGWTWPDFSRSYYLGGFAIATAIHLVTAYLVGLYEREPRFGARSWLPRVVLAMLIGVAVEGLAFVILDRYLMPRLNLAILAIAGSIALLLNRALARALARRRLGPPRVLLVGSSEECDLAEIHLSERSGYAQVVGRTGRFDELVNNALSAGATDILLLGNRDYWRVFPHPLQDLEEHQISVFQRVNPAQTLLGLHEIREVGGIPFVALRARSLPRHQYVLKRALDLTLLLVGLPLILLVVGLTALFVRVRAGSPVLFRQVRVGRFGETFEMIKFRTMGLDAEADGAVLSSGDDPRVIKGMSVLRGTRLDETPQLWHVVKGQMSIVGPRPERPEFTAQLAKEIPGYERRFEMAPGLTGLAQVNGRYSTDAEYKIGYDLQYVADWSIWLDISLLVRTVWVVLSRRV